MLRRKDGLELLPSLVRDHGVLEHAGGVDEANQVRRHPLDILVHGSLRAHVHGALLDRNPQLLRLPLNLLPIRHVHVAHLRRPRKKMDRELRLVAPTAGGFLLLDGLQQPQAHDQAQRAVAAGDRDDALGGDDELDPCLLVVVRRHLPCHVPAGGLGDSLPRSDRVGEAMSNGVHTEGRHPEKLREHVGDRLGAIRELHID
mmetsp:Transcript_64004/g.179076  ORF Transcript_64004/g.179076 Transcript_64004/m.179076 type:complete len:201 (+) Transcript_64004:780-1382(+)